MYSLTMHQYFFIFIIVFYISNANALPFKLNKKIKEDLYKQNIDESYPSIFRVPHNTSKRTYNTISLNHGDSFYKALSSYSLSSIDLLNILHVSKKHIDLNTLSKKQKITVVIHSQTLSEIHVPFGFDHTLVLYKQMDVWQSMVKTSPTKIERRLIKGVITGSLYNSALQAGVPPKIINQCILILSSSVNFTKDLNKGDHFEILFNTKVNLITPDKITPLSLEFVSLSSRGIKKSLFKFKHNENTGFYTRDGYSPNPILLLNPVNKGQLSSYFGPRLHPVLGYKRMHKGIDFDAYHGAQVIAAGNGTIVKKTYSPSFGYYVKIRHEQGYETLYAHLDRFPKQLRKGLRVKQGQLIGYLGNSGLSTAKHLHYEVHQYGKAINPLSLRANQKKRLTGDKYDRFIAKVADIEALLPGLALVQN